MEKENIIMKMVNIIKDKLNFNFKHGKGKFFGINDNILYEGDFIKDKREGKGKYYYENGEYYDGEFKNDLRNGKGIEYYKNKKVKYDGDFINDMYDGNGKFY